MTAGGSDEAIAEIRKKDEIAWALARHDMILRQSLFDPPVDNTELFLYDSWRNYKGLQYLAGILYFEGPEKNEVDRGDVSKIVTLMREVYIAGGESEHVANALIDRYAKLCRIWESGNHPEYNPPLFYIEWAISKGYIIPWEHNVATKLEWILPPEKKREYPLFAKVVAAYQPQAKRDEKTLNLDNADWKDKAKIIAQEVGLEKYRRDGVRNISVRGVHGEVATRLAKDPSTHGLQGQRSADNVRVEGLKGWKFIYPKEEKEADWINSGLTQENPLISFQTQ